jgi:hypothetical protein
LDQRGSKLLRSFSDTWCRSYFCVTTQQRMKDSCVRFASLLSTLFYTFKAPAGIGYRHFLRLCCENQKPLEAEGFLRVP